MSSASPCVLLTGFAPFGGDEENPSRLVARALDRTRVAGLAVVTAELPVSAAALSDALAPLWALEPVAVVHLGLAGGRSQIAVERIAVNLLDFPIPDNTGERLRDQSIVADGPAAYWATLPVTATVEAIRHAGVPAYASLTAGAFLCNAAMYLSLHHLAATGRGQIPGGFVHLPYLPAQAAAKRPDTASLSLDAMVEAARLTLECAILHHRARVPGAWTAETASALAP